jgi:putative addiction module CopG family antidote
MEIHPTPDQEAFIRLAIESGRFRQPEEAIREALALWEERERRRADLLASIDEAEESLAGGEGRALSQEGMSELAEEVKRRGRARLRAEQDTRR